MNKDNELWLNVTCVSSCFFHSPTLSFNCSFPLAEIDIGGLSTVRSSRLWPKSQMYCFNSLMCIS